MFTHPGFNPIALQIGSFGIHWYGLMYLIGFFGGLWLGQYQVKRLRRIDPASPWQERDPDDMLFYIALGVVLGGRLGYVLFYQPSYFLQHPLEIFALWQGGMSFRAQARCCVAAVDGLCRAASAYLFGGRPIG